MVSHLQEERSLVRRLSVPMELFGDRVLLKPRGGLGPWALGLES